MRLNNAAIVELKKILIDYQFKIQYQRHVASVWRLYYLLALCGPIISHDDLKFY